MMNELTKQDLNVLYILTAKELAEREKDKAMCERLELEHAFEDQEIELLKPLFEKLEKLK